MNHDALKERLMEFYDGELPEGERRVVEEHVASCRSCEAVLRRWGAVARVLFKDRPVFAPDLARKVVARLEAPEGRPLPARESWWFGGWTPALGLGLAAFLMAVAWPEPEGVPAAETVLLADAGETLTTFLEGTSQEDDLLTLAMEDL